MVPPELFAVYNTFHHSGITYNNYDCMPNYNYNY